jgi:hypothetical protein
MALSGKKPESERGDVTHHEYVDAHTPTQQLEPTLAYDNTGIMGIIRSPYVFGAALLASFGGFSFGYGRFLGHFV